MAKDNEKENINTEEVAENKTETKEEKPKYTVLKNLKYNKDVFKIGDEIGVLKKDTKEMLDKKLIELK